MSLVHMLNYIVADQFEQFSVDIGNHIQVAHMCIEHKMQIYPLHSFCISRPHLSHVEIVVCNYVLFFFYCSTSTWSEMKGVTGRRKGRKRREMHVQINTSRVHLQVLSHFQKMCKSTSTKVLTLKNKS